MGIKLPSVDRIFSGDKVVDSFLWNCLGAQVLRTVAARWIYNTFPVSVSGIVEDKFAELRREGIVAWPNFLARDDFERIKRECATLIRNHDQVKVEKWGANTVERVFLKNAEPDATPSIHRLITDERLQGILETAEKRPLGRLSAHAQVERLIQGPGQNSEDTQTQIHSDTFFACHKCWFYISDVNLEDGPLIYLKGSHKLNPRQLLHIYKWSCSRRLDDDQSRRVTASELAKMRQQKEIFTCASNTLVIANMYGYHGRLQGEPGRERWAVHLQLRADPFRVLLRRRLHVAVDSLLEMPSPIWQGR
jgi:hypothetical protein